MFYTYHYKEIVGKLDAGNGGAETDAFIQLATWLTAINAVDYKIITHGFISKPYLYEITVMAQVHRS